MPRLKSSLIVTAVLTSLLALGAGLPSHAAFGDKSAKTAAEVDLTDPMTVKARFQPSTIEAGATPTLILDLTLAESYHAYLDRLKLSIEKPDDLKLAPFKVSPLVQFYDPASKSQKIGIEGRATLQAVVGVPTGFQPGEQKVQLKFVYQACTAEHCLFPKTIVVEAPLTIHAGAAAIAPPPAASSPVASAAPKYIVTGSLGGATGVGTYRMKAGPSPAPSTAPAGAQQAPAASATVAPPAVAGMTAATSAPAESQFTVALQKSLFSAFLLVFGVGFLTCFTPCIYPMIPITLAVLGARAHGQSHWKNFSLALVYVLGIAMTYSVLGVIAASTGSFFGAALGNIWVVSAIALMFFAMGLSMFGLFEVQAPGFIRNRLGAGRTNQGYTGAFATGLVAGIVASPCIGPVLVSILTFIAQTQSRALGFFMLFTFALGMGIPFIALGLSSSALTRLPKAGRWMEAVKIFFGLVMIGMAFYYIRPIYPAWLFLFVLGAALIVLASLFGAFSRDPAARGRRVALIGALSLGVVAAAAGVAERLGVQLPGRQQTEAAKKSPLAWQPYTAAALEEAVKMRRPVVIDFTAEWCGACQEMEQTTFVDERVVDVMKNFALFQVDGTDDTAELHEILGRFQVQGFPTYIFYDRQGQERKDLNAFGYVPAPEFLKRLEAAAVPGSFYRSGATDSKKPSLFSLLQSHARSIVQDQDKEVAVHVGRTIRWEVNAGASPLDRSDILNGNRRVARKSPVGALVSHGDVDR